MKPIKRKVEKEKFLVEINSDEKEGLFLSMYAASQPSLRVRKYKECATDNFSEPYCIKDIDIILADEPKNRLLDPNFRLYRTCLPKEVAVFFRKNMAKKSKLPTGVSYDNINSIFRSYCRINGVRKKVGTFRDPELAFIAYKEVKESEAKRVAQLYYDNGEIDKDTYDFLMRWEVKR